MDSMIKTLKNLRRLVLDLAEHSQRRIEASKRATTEAEREYHRGYAKGYQASATLLSDALTFGRAKEQREEG